MAVVGMSKFVLFKLNVDFIVFRRLHLPHAVYRRPVVFTVLLAGQRYVVRAEKILPTTKSSSQQCHRPPFILLSFSTDLEAAHFEFAFSNVWLWIEWIFYMLKDGLEAHVLDGWVGHEPHPEVAAG